MRAFPSFLLLLLLLLLLTLGSSLPACHKADEGPTTATGRVVDSVTGQGVAGATVTLWASGGGGNVLTGSAPQIDQQTTTDAQGHYHFAFDADQQRRYQLQGARTGYLSGSSESQPRVNLTRGSKNDVDVPLKPEGYLRVRFLSPSPEPNTLAILGEPRYLAFSIGVRADQFGSSIDSSFIVPAKGGEQTLVRWVIYPSGIGATTYEQTVLCPAHDTADFTISF